MSTKNKANKNNTPNNSLTYDQKITFKNIHPDFKKIKVNLFDIENKNEGVQIFSDITDLQLFKKVFSNLMHKAVGIRIHSAGNHGISGRNLHNNEFRFISKEKTGRTKTIKWDPSATISAYQWSETIIEKRDIAGYFSLGDEHELEFFIYPDTELSITFFFTE